MVSCCDHASTTAQLHLWQGMRMQKALSHLLGSIYDALCDDVAFHDATKDVDQQRLDLLVTRQNLEGSHHLQGQGNLVQRQELLGSRCQRVEPGRPTPQPHSCPITTVQAPAPKVLLSAAHANSKATAR